MGGGGEIPSPFFSIKAVPATIHDLLGKPCRIVRPGDVVTQDYVPNRVNIYLNEKSQISDIKFG